jgi:magnesium transporter
MDTLWNDDGGNTLFYRINIMDLRPMEKLEKKLNSFEEDIFEGKDIDVKEFYKLKKQLLDTKKDNQDLLELHMILETMLDKQQNELMNKRLNLLTIWSTIFLPLSFYTGMWGMNFDDVPLLNGDHGFWIFLGLSIVTIVGMWIYFRKNKWI